MPRPAYTVHHFNLAAHLGVPQRLPRWAGLAPATGGTPKLALSVVCQQGVPRPVAQAVRALARGLALVSPPQHHVRCLVTRGGTFASGDGRTVFGLFIEPEGHSGGITHVGMAVAGGFHTLLRAVGAPPQGAMQGLLEVVGHEYAHYEQWRGGRPCTERGVEVRARSLVRQALAAIKNLPA